MKREELKALGITDEAQIEAVMKLHGVDIESHKTAINTLTSERDTFKSQLDEAGKQIADFTKMDIESVKKAATEWETKAKQVEADSTAKIQALNFDHALEKELQGYKVKDPADVIPHLKRDMLKLEDGKIIGLKEQVEALKTAKDYLFQSETQDTKLPRIVAGGNGQPVINDPMMAAARQAAGLKEK
jgi:hypothetical protein